MEVQLRDLRVKEKFTVDDKYLNGYARVCGIYSTGVYLSLCRHANRDQWCFPSINLIAQELDISTRSVIRAIDILEKHLIVGVIRPGKKLVNKYYLLDKSVWSKSEVTESHITSVLQSLHLVTDSHTKGTHLKETQLRSFYSKSRNREELRGNMTDADVRRLVQR